ncbi:MAG: hypothetical protein ACR2QL_04705 [Woeseiaceae bacterium]
MRNTLIVLSCFAALMITACTGDSSRPVATGKGAIRSINAIPTAPPLLFLIEERAIGNVDYSSSSTQNSFDDLRYLFNFETTFADEILRTRIATVDLKMERDFLYTIIASGDLEAPLTTVWEKPLREWDGTETVFEAQFGHTAESLGPIDVYFAAPGIAPAVGEEIGTVAFGEILPVGTYTSGEFVYIATTAGNPGDILFTSTTFNPAPSGGFIISVFDGTANNVGTYGFKVFTDDGASSNLTSDEIPPSVRFIHSNATVGATDIYTDELLMDQILANHSFREVTGDIDLPSNLYPFTYTAAGNPGSILVERSILIIGASHSQIYLFGDDASPSASLRIPDRRSVETQVKLTFVHGAANHPLVDFYLVEAGTDINDVNPQFIRIAPGQAPPVTNPNAGDLEMYLTVSGEKTIITGPVPLTAAYGDVYEYISYDNVDPTTADLVSIPLP